MHEKSDIHAAFTAMASHYEKSVDRELRLFWGWSYNDFIQNLIDKAGLQNDDIVLDVATGTAVIPRKLVDCGKTGGEIIGLDITPAMLWKANQKIQLRTNLLTSDDKPSLPAPIRLTCASAMAMPYLAAHFDVILCALASHHLDIPVVLAEMARILKPGGKLLLSDVLGLSIWQIPAISFLMRTATLIFFLPLQGLARARAESSALYHICTEEEWEKNLKAAGLCDVSIELLPTNHSWLPAPMVIQARKPKMEV